MQASCRCNRSMGAALLTALLGWAMPGAASAADTPPELIDDAVIAAYAERGDGKTPLTLEQPPRVRYELGAVIDAQPADGGPPQVMAVTPRRAADRMGLQVGDRLLALGEARFDGSVDAAAVLRDAVAGGQGVLRFELLRDGRRTAATGHLDRIDIPGYRLQIEPPPAPAQGCGRISTFLKPPVSESIYPALLHEINGRLYGSLDSEVLRVPAGRHVLKVTELVDSNRFLSQQNRQRGRVMRNERFKFLEIDVRPNTKYHLGVRFHPDRRDPIRDQAYWEPVIWKETAEPCR